MTEAETNPPEHYMGFQSVTEAETERAAIVAYLHDGGTSQGCKTATIGLRLRAAWISFRRPWAFPQVGCVSAAAAIERGEHKRAADNGETM